jgi:hypothetical protein
MRLNIAKTRIVSYSRKTNILSYEYHLCLAAIICTNIITDLDVFFDSNLYFHNHANLIFSKCTELLYPIRSITFTLYSRECLYVLYFTLVRSVVRNSITSIDASSRILSPSVSVAFPLMFLTVILFPSSCKRRHHLDAIFQVSRGYKSYTSLFENVTLRARTRNVRTSRSLVFIPLINTIFLLGALMLPTW